MINDKMVVANIQSKFIHYSFLKYNSDTLGKTQKPKLGHKLYVSYIPTNY